MHAENANADHFPAPRKWFSTRVVVTLLLLLALICASVLLTEHYAVRDRGAATKPAHTPELPQEAPK